MICETEEETENGNNIQVVCKQRWRLSDRNKESFTPNFIKLDRKKKNLNINFAKSERVVIPWHMHVLRIRRSVSSHVQ